MSNASRIGVVTLGLLALLAVTPAQAQDQPQPDPAMQAAMKAYIEYGTPGAAQKEMAKGVGAWKVVNRYYPAPGAPAEESKGTSEITSWWDGRYFVEKFEGKMPDGTPFSGFGISAYDNLKKVYQSTWMDSMSTGVMVMEGTADASGKVVTFRGEMPDPPSGKLVKVRTVVRMIDDNTRDFEMYCPGPDGKEFRMMEMRYTR